MASDLYFNFAVRGSLLYGFRYTAVAPVKREVYYIHASGKVAPSSPFGGNARY